MPENAGKGLLRGGTVGAKDGPYTCGKVLPCTCAARGPFSRPYEGVSPQVHEITGDAPGRAPFEVSEDLGEPAARTCPALDGPGAAGGREQLDGAEVAAAKANARAYFSECRARSSAHVISEKWADSAPHGRAETGTAIASADVAIARAGIAARAWTAELAGPAPAGWSTAAVQRARRLAELAVRTAAHRGKRAALLMSRERTARGGSGTYHRARARAQLRRWEQVAMCETDNVLHVWAQCKNGSAAWDASAATPASSRDACDNARAVARCGCGVERACRLCRVELVHQKRAQAERAIEAVAELYAPELTRAVNPWAWRMATLTIPPGLGIDRDVADLAPMLADLRRWLNAWWLNEGNETAWRQVFCEQKNADGETVIGVRKLAPPWLAHIEIEPGKTRYAHTHAHLALCSPFVPTEVVRFYWGKALVKHGRAAHVPMTRLGDVLALAFRTGEEWRVSQVADALVTRRGKNGRPVELVPWPVTHIERAYGKNDGGDVARELVKYVVKDVSDGESILPVELEADIYCALDGRRSLLSQRGLWALGAAPSIHDQPCPGCGACEGFMVWIGPPPSDEKPSRGPPDIDDPMRALRGHMAEVPLPHPAADGSALPYAGESPEAADLRLASHVVVDPLGELEAAGIFPAPFRKAPHRPRVASLTAARVGALIRSAERPGPSTGG